MRGSGKFCQRGSNSDNDFSLVDEGRTEDLYTSNTKSEPSSVIARQ